MPKKDNNSSLKQHVMEKKGILASPLNHSLRETLSLNSWSRDRLPEYLWLGLILENHERKEGLNLLGHMLKDIAENIEGLSYPRLSSILKLEEAKQNELYKIVLRYAKKATLSPLTLILNSDKHPLFYRTFGIVQMPIEYRLQKLRNSIRTYYPTHANEATDLRFLAMLLLLFTKRLHFSEQTRNAAEAFSRYPLTNHDDEIMKLYRPTIRSMEGIDFEQQSYPFSQFFWDEIGKIDDCSLFYIKYEEGNLEMEHLLEDSRNAIDYLISSNKILLLDNDKFTVLTGSVCYALKIFEEMCSNNLGNAVLGRHGIRTILEISIMIKYLLRMEVSKPNIWKEYKLYGISKYKLILLKSRENENKEDSHFIEPMADAIVNEIMYEEFIDIDLKYFDQTGIREKSIEANEKNAYDILYDYDSSFVHGLWGSVRESSMLLCDNANHKYHSVPDVFNSQKLPSVLKDAEKAILKIMTTIDAVYSLPEYYKSKYKLDQTV
jgi:hypothetical protein